MESYGGGWKKGMEYFDKILIANHENRRQVIFEYMHIVGFGIHAYLG
jgi:hypothetical protein